MSETDSIEAASRRLALALDALDAAADRRREAARNEEALSVQIHALGDDRARLAGELDTAIARSRALETASRDVAKRLDAAIEAVRGVLAGHDGKEDVRANDKDEKVAEEDRIDEEDEDGEEEADEDDEDDDADDDEDEDDAEDEDDSGEDDAEDEDDDGEEEDDGEAEDDVEEEDDGEEEDDDGEEEDDDGEEEDEDEDE